MVRKAMSSGTSVSRSPWRRRTGQSIAIALSSRSSRCPDSQNPRVQRRAVVQLRRLLGGKAPVGEVRRRRDPDQRPNPVRPEQRQVKRDPPAHRRADDDQRPLRQLVERRERFLEPQRQSAVREPAAARARPRIVEAQHRQPALPGPCVERQRLRPLHVRRIAGQEDQGRRRTGAQPVGDLPPRNLEMPKLGHRHRSADEGRRSRCEVQPSCLWPLNGGSGGRESMRIEDA